MPSPAVPILHLQRELACSGEWLRQYCRKHKYARFPRPVRGYSQPLLCLTAEHADAIRAYRAQMHPPPDADPHSPDTPPEVECAYVVDLDPEREPAHIKIGRSVHPKHRLADNRAWCPTAQLLRVAPDAADLERALQLIAAHISPRVVQFPNLRETFQLPRRDLPKLLAEADRLFKLTTPRTRRAPTT